MLTINGKIFMNISEAVQWLLNNNALPFQCKVNFVADTEISKTDIINPAPAELKIGSLVLFADGIVGTVNAVTTNGFKVGPESTDLSDGVPHIVNISIDASNHLIFTMSEGDPIDAGLIKMVSGFSIDGSQHLIVNYNDGTTNDLGAIFNGNITISGNLSVTGSTSVNTLTSPNNEIPTSKPIIETMSGYVFTPGSKTGLTITPIYAGVCKNGNKLTIVYFVSVTRTDNVQDGFAGIGRFTIPNSVLTKLYPYTIGESSNALDYRRIGFYKRSDGTQALVKAYLEKDSVGVVFTCTGMNTPLELNEEYVVRFENTFLLSNNLAS